MGSLRRMMAGRSDAARGGGDLRAARIALAAALACGLGYLLLIIRFAPTLQAGRFPLPWAVPIYEGPFAVASLAAGYLCFQRHRLREDVGSAALGVGLWVTTVFTVSHMLSQPDYGWRSFLPPPVAPAFLFLAYTAFFMSLGLSAYVGRRRLPLTDRSRVIVGVGAFVVAAGIVAGLVLAAPALPPLVKAGILTPAGRWFGLLTAGAAGVWSLLGVARKLWRGNDLPFTGFLALSSLLLLAAVAGFLLVPFRYSLTWYVAGFARPVGASILFLGLLSEQIGLYRDARSRQRVFEGLHRAGQAMMATLDQRKLLNIITQGVMEVSDAEGAILYEVAGDPAVLRPVSWSGRFTSFISEEVCLPVGVGVAGRAAAEGLPFWSSDAAADSGINVTPEYVERVRSEGLKALLAVPLRVRGEIFGALVVAYWRAREFRNEDVQLLSTFAAQAAAALENSRLYNEVKSQLATIERVQSQLVQIEKLSAIGQFVAGVAHELNNPLTVVLGEAELLMQRDVPPAIREELAEIRDAARRTARIVEGLSTFARQHAPSREVTDIHEVIAQALRLRASQLTLDNIRVVEEFDRSLPHVAVDSHQIVQVLVNVINNAHQAIKGIRQSGTIVVRTSRAVDGVEIEVEDDGPGIPLAVLPKLFDPFFTTKPVGQGTGLGLSISHGIVRQHGGVISARNRPGGGAIFRVTLPVEAGSQVPIFHGGGKPEARKDETTGEHAIGGGPCRVLVVDDDAHVANALAKIIASLGHRVDRAHSAEEARRKIAADHFDALILDFKMPAMDGRALWEEIRQTHPGLERSVIFMTGDVADPETSAFLARTGLPCLFKPFLPNEILAALGAVLTARRKDAEPRRD